MEDKKWRRPTSAFSVNRPYHSVTQFETLASEESDQDANCLGPNWGFTAKSEEKENVKVHSKMQGALHPT
jgi:hypothetical protein